jgi:hypothetical protein
MINRRSLLLEEIQRLPAHYHETFSNGFLELLAALRLHGFAIQRADEAALVTDADHDLWSELSHPSIWLHEPSAPANKLRRTEPSTPEHKELINRVIRANLAAQRRLLALLAGFYSRHTPTSLPSRLIIETIDLGETCLRPQGASVRLVLDEEDQRRWLQDSRVEMKHFADYLTELEP